MASQAKFAVVGEHRQLKANVDQMLPTPRFSKLSQPPNTMVVMDKVATEDRMADWKSDPKLRAMTKRILSMPVEARLRQLEEEAKFFNSIRPLDR